MLFHFVGEAGTASLNGTPQLVREKMVLSLFSLTKSWMIEKTNDPSNRGPKRLDGLKILSDVMRDSAMIQP